MSRSLLDQAADIRAKAKAARAAVESLRLGGDDSEWPVIYGAIEDVEGAASQSMHAEWNHLSALERIAINALANHRIVPAGDTT